MRRVIFFIAAVLTAAAALWSCQPEESRTSASVLKPVTIGEVVIPSSGGTSAFIYMIENPVEGGELSLEVPGDASWIVSTDISVQDTVLITAAPNPDTLSRSTTLTLNYESTFLLIKVLQRGTEMGDGGFAFNVTDVKTTMATVEVYPADKEMTYVAFSVAKEYMDGFESEEEFFLDDLEYMQSMADNAGVSLSTFLSEQALRTGDSGPIEFRNLKQATDYYVYAYGLTSLGIKTTPISRQVFRTSAPGESDLTLEIISIEVESNSAVVSVVPSDPEQPYYIGAVEMDDVHKFYGGE